MNNNSTEYRKIRDLIKYISISCRKIKAKSCLHTIVGKYILMKYKCFPNFWKTFFPIKSNWKIQMLVFLHNNSKQTSYISS